MKGKRNNKIDLAIITAEPFPLGMAATNRLISYSSVLADTLKLKVYITKPTETNNNIRNKESEGVVNGIKFNYIHGFTIWPKNRNKIHKLYLLVKGFYITIKTLIKDKPRSVLLVSNSFYWMFGLWILSKITGYYYFQEKSELPPVEKVKTNSMYKKLYLSFYKAFDGMIVMTSTLKDYFHSLGQENIFILPMTVDFKRFENPSQSLSEKEHFLYCGGGNYERDGLIEMIEAFIAFNSYHPDYELHIIGPIKNNDQYFNKMLSLINQHPAATTIKMLGTKNSDEIPGYLQSANGLIMTPVKDFDSGGFPTKLGEYLASGVPVICSLVSEIPLFLNNTQAYLVAPGNVEQIKNAMLEIVNNTKKSSQLAEAGRLHAKSVFSAEIYKNDLISFLRVYDKN